ncbi:MAG: cation-translocating P-type ATPase, partial [Clostridia bacterium]|nr:cation-translocating P-type ATPase [Clostridia bacterium]
IIGINVRQEWKTDKTLNALRGLSAPHITVIRDGAESQIASAELVPGDVMLIREGDKIPADGSVLRCSDLCVDEATLTGEAEWVWKDSGDLCFAGTLVTQGSAIVRIDKTGTSTEYGKISANMAAAPMKKTPLQKQTGRIVTLFGVCAAVFFVLVSTVTWQNVHDHELVERVVESFLAGITIAMAMIPEEFPVILTVFLSMGAWRLARKNSLVRRLPAVETLGAVSVLCVDKTGTITKNSMTVQDIWAASDDDTRLIETMGLACETHAYDPMEIAMLSYCEKQAIGREHLFGGTMIKEYAFTNELKMMGHVWRHDGELLIAAKGSPEQILGMCGLSEAERRNAEAKVAHMGQQGLRAIAVAIDKLSSEAEIPKELTDCTLTICGLVGLADPPRDSVAGDIAVCYKAGIRVVMITGDNGITAAAIAHKIGMKNIENIVTGGMLDNLTKEELQERVKTVSIFSRVLPEHKMRIIKAFQANGEIVAMTGDGVNDAPALKNADIGIAMGGRGSEVSREAADMVLLDDNFSTIVDTVRDGRRIYDNIRKAMAYVLTIHIPIALASLLAPMLGVSPAGLMLLPLHVVLLELIVDPTCSVVLERQPAEHDIMDRPPRQRNQKLLAPRTLLRSIAQGLTIFAASFGAYYSVIINDPENATLARSLGLSVIMLANLLLVLVNSSDVDSIFTAIKRLGKDKVMWAVFLVTLAGLAAILYSPLNRVFNLAPLSFSRALLVLGLAMGSVLWYEGVKFRKRHALKNPSS